MRLTSDALKVSLFTEWKLREESSEWIINCYKNLKACAMVVRECRSTIHSDKKLCLVLSRKNNEDDIPLDALWRQKLVHFPKWRYRIHDLTFSDFFLIAFVPTPCCILLTTCFSSHKFQVLLLIFSFPFFSLFTPRLMFWCKAKLPFFSFLAFVQLDATTWFFSFSLSHSLHPRMEIYSNPCFWKFKILLWCWRHKW